MAQRDPATTPTHVTCHPSSDGGDALAANILLNGFKVAAAQGFSMPSQPASQQLVMHTRI